MELFTSIWCQQPYGCDIINYRRFFSMKTTKRVLSMVLALMMFFSLSVTAFADTVVKAPDIKGNPLTSQKVLAGSLVEGG